MSMRTREAERYFGESLRAHTAFEVKAIPDYKAIASARKAERAWLRSGYVVAVIMAAIIFAEVVTCL